MIENRSLPLLDIFGKELKHGDLIGYASSTGLFLTIIASIRVNRLGNPVRLKLIYPHVKYNYRETSHTLEIASKYMLLGQQELIKISWEDFKNYRGHESFGNLSDVNSMVMGLSNCVLWEHGNSEGISWLWGNPVKKGLGYYYTDELGIDLGGPFETYNAALEAQKMYLETI